MENITMTNATPVTRVRFARPQSADRSLTTGTRHGYHGPTQKAFAVKDVARLRSWSLLV